MRDCPSSSTKTTSNQNSSIEWCRYARGCTLSMASIVLHAITLMRMCCMTTCIATKIDFTRFWGGHPQLAYYRVSTRSSLMVDLHKVSWFYFTCYLNFVSFFDIGVQISVAIPWATFSIGLKLVDLCLIIVKVCRFHAHTYFFVHKYWASSPFGDITNDV